MRKDEWETTNRALVTAAIAVFAEHGEVVAHVGRSNEVPEGWTNVAIIGYAGEAMRGMLALSLSHDLLVRVCPLRGQSQDDWHCELANLIVARFKRELLMLGVTVHLSTPILASGTNVSLDTEAVSVVVHRFESAQRETAFLVLDAVAIADTRLGAADTSAIVASGDVVLF